MCGRYFLRPSLDEILAFFDAEADEVGEVVSPRLNIAPTQQVLACYQDPLAGRRLGAFRWGFTPSWWSKDKPATFLNARAETVVDKPSFRSAIRHHRCLVPASGFYEWTSTGPKTKQAWAIAPEGDLYAFAGIWETWSKGPAPLQSLAILTQASTGPMAQVHDRMPVVVPPASFGAWLSPRTDTATRDALLAPAPPALRIWQVGPGVGQVRNSSGDWFDVQA